MVRRKSEPKEPKNDAVPPKTKKEKEAKAFDLIAGKLGKGDDVKEALANDGFSYDEVHEIARKILLGEYFK